MVCKIHTNLSLPLYDPLGNLKPSTLKPTSQTSWMTAFDLSVSSTLLALNPIPSATENNPGDGAQQPRKTSADRRRERKRGRERHLFIEWQWFFFNLYCSGLKCVISRSKKGGVRIGRRCYGTEHIWEQGQSNIFSIVRAERLILLSI